MAETIKFAAAPLYNFALPRGQSIASIGQYRLVKVRPDPQRNELLSEDVVAEMKSSRRLAPWVSTLEDGYRQRRDNTPDYMVYYFPPAKIASRWFQSADPREDMLDARRFLDALLAAFRLRKAERVFIPPSLMIGVAVPNPELDSILRGDGPETTENVVFMNRPPYLDKDERLYQLNKGDVPEVERLCEIAASAFTTRLEIALRRFVGSQEKNHADRFVDLLIALEALYGDSDRTALAHKIAFRASTITVQSLRARERMFTLVKQAYDRRSSILHGQAADMKWVRQNLGLVENVVRWSLIWALNRLSETGNVPGGKDVDTLCFQTTPAQL